MANEDEIVALNVKIRDRLRQYLGDNSEIQLRFDAPDPASPPATPTVHLFLYLIHEDLALRHGEPTRYEPQHNRFQSRRANVRCLYLVTYWDPESGKGGDAPSAAPNSQTVIVLNRVIKALLSMRGHPDFTQFAVRTIEPEALNSLGNFWQALGNKPKTIVNFAVTLPVSYSEPEENVPLVASVQSRVTLSNVGWQQALEDALLQQLSVNLAGDSPLLNKVVLTANAWNGDTSGQDTQVIKADVQVAGLAWKEQAEQMAAIIQGWQGLSLQLPQGVVEVMSCSNHITAVASPTRSN